MSFFDEIRDQIGAPAADMPATAPDVAPAAPSSANPTVGEFVAQVAPAAIEAGRRLGVDPSILIGQWGLETGWGKSVIPGTNNLGNIKDFSGNGIAATDNMTGSRDRYRQYASINDFGSDYAGLIERRYGSAIGAGQDAVRYAEALKAGGYAEDPAYVEKMARAAEMVRGAGVGLGEGWDGAPAGAGQQGGAVSLEPDSFLASGFDALERRDRQEASDESPMSTNLSRGWRQMSDSLGNYVSLLEGDEAAIVERLQEAQKFDAENPMPTATAKFYQDWTDENYLTAMINIPGFAGGMVEQLANSLPSMIGSIPGMIAGGVAGAAAGPVGVLLGASAGGALGSAPGSVALETGARISAMAGKAGVDVSNPAAFQAWLTENRDAILAEGMSKGLTVAAIDGIAGGVGSAIIARPALRLQQAERRILERMGINGADDFAVAAARRTPQYQTAIKPFKAEFDVANTAGANAMRGFASFAAESMGEFGGEYAGEVAATGEGNFNEALLEGVMGAGQSAVTTGAQFAAKKIMQPNSPLTNAANMAASSAPPAAPGAPAGSAGQGAAADPTARLAELEAITNGTPAQTVMGPNGQPMTIPGAQPRLFTQQEQDEYRALKAQMGGTSPAAEQQGTAPDPLAQRVSAVASIVEDKALISSLRSDPRFGKESVTDLLAAYAKARNPSLDPMIRTQALDSIDAFMRTFENRPNFTMGGAQAEQGGDQQQAGAPDLFGAKTPQLEAPAFAERDITPRAPTPELETDQILQARRTADAEYDQAFQDLVKAEQLGASDAELMEYQQALEDAKQARAELDAELEAVQRRIEDSRKKQTAEKRRAILDDILSDPETANPAVRFTAELQRQGFTQIVPDADEMATIQRFEDAREAMATLPAEEAPVQPAQPAQAAKPVQTDGNARQDGNAKPRLTVDQVKQAVTAGANLDGNVLRAPGADPIALQGPMLAAAREAVRRREAGPALSPVAQGVRDAVESGGLARPNVVSQPQQGGVTTDVPTAEQVAPQAQEAGGQEGAAAGEGTGVGAVAERPTQAPTAPEQSRPEPGQRSEPAQPDTDAAREAAFAEAAALVGRTPEEARAAHGRFAADLGIEEADRILFANLEKYRAQAAESAPQAADRRQQAFDAVAEALESSMGWKRDGNRLEKSFEGLHSGTGFNQITKGTVTIARGRGDFVVASYGGDVIASEIAPEFAEPGVYGTVAGVLNARVEQAIETRKRAREELKPTGDLREDIARAYIRGRHDRYGHSLGDPTSNDYAFADDIINKNVYALEHLANGMNDVAKAVFEQFTGVKLPKQQGKTWSAMLEWAGVTPEQDAVRKAEHRVGIEERSIEGQFDNTEAARKWAADRVADGYDTIEKSAAGETWLMRADGTGFNLSKRGTRLSKMQPLLRAHINLKAARKALEDAERSTNTATQEESTDAGTGQEDGQEWDSAALRAPEGEGIGRPAGPWSIEDLNEDPALYRSAGEYLDARASDGTILVKAIDATLADRDAALGLALPGMDRPALPADLMIAFIEDAPIKGDLKPSEFDPKYTLRYAGHTLDLEIVELEPGDVVLGLPPLVLHEGYDRRDGEEFAPLSAYRVPGIDGLFDFVDAVEQGYAVLAQRAGQSPAGAEMDADIADQFADAADPTDSQKEAGNYQMAHVRIDGMDVSIETEKGAQRSGKDADGTAWTVTMPSAYGYIKGTKGADKDHVDIFVGPNPDNGTYYIINQNKPNTYGTKKRFDEHKVAVGFDSEHDAVANYLLSFADDFGAKVFGSVAGPYTADELKALIPALAEAKPIARKKADNGVTTRRIRIDDNPAVEVTLPSGNVYRMNRLTAGESMGLAGWHDMDRDQFSFLGDNQEQAIAALIERDADAEKRRADEAENPAEAAQRQAEASDIPTRDDRSWRPMDMAHVEQDTGSSPVNNWRYRGQEFAGTEILPEYPQFYRQDLVDSLPRDVVAYVQEKVRERIDHHSKEFGTPKRPALPAGAIPEPKNWRTSYGAAQKYAEALGVNPRGEDGKYLKLPALVAAIDAKRGGATAANPSSDFPVSLDVKTFIATFPEFNEFGLSQVWMNEDGSIERTVSDYELDTAVLQRYTKSDFLNAYRDGRVRETAVEARRGAGSADVSLVDEGKAAAVKKRDTSDEVDSESARRAEFPLSGGADAKIIETARHGEFSVYVAGESYGSFKLGDSGKVFGVKARAGWAEPYVREAANTFAAMQRGETTNVADAALTNESKTDGGQQDELDADVRRQALEKFDSLVDKARQRLETLESNREKAKATRNEWTWDAKIAEAAAALRQYEEARDNFVGTQPAGPAAAPASARPQLGEDGYTLQHAQEDLAALREKADAQGIVTDARLLEKIRTFEQIVEDLRWNGAEPDYRAGHAFTADGGEQWVIQKNVRPGDDTITVIRTKDGRPYTYGRSFVEGEMRRGQDWLFEQEQIAERAKKDRATERKTAEPKSLDDLRAALEAGDKAHFDYAGAHGRTLWIDDMGEGKGWALHSKEDDSPVVIRSGGDPRAGGYSKDEAVARALADAQYRFTEWKPVAEQQGAVDQILTGKVKTLTERGVDQSQINQAVAEYKDGDATLIDDLLRISAPESPAGAAPATTDDDLDTMFDEILAEELAAKPKREKKVRAQAPASEVHPRIAAILDSGPGGLLGQVGASQNNFALVWRDAYTDAALALEQQRDNTLSEGEIEALYNRAFDTEFVAREAAAYQARHAKAAAQTGAQKPAATPRKPRGAGAAAKSAAKNTAAGLADAIAGLGKLFGGNGRLSSGLTFDEETYEKAKPLFKSAIAHFKDAKNDLKAVMREIVRMVVEQFGPHVAGNMKPYATRFVADVRDGKIDYDEGVADTTGENDERGSTGGTGDSSLGGASAAEDGGPEGSGDAGDAGETGGGARDDGDRRDDAEGRGPDDGRGDGAAGVHHPAAGGVSASNTPATNFVITDDVRLGQGGEVQKFNDNLAAIRIVKRLEAERRRATPDEQRQLARYVGWGGLPNAFRNRETGLTKDGWEKRVLELEALLTRKELESARSTTTDAHYTSQAIVRGMWAIAQRLGFKGGAVLEPSMGTGNFFGLVPEALRGDTRFIGIEYDSLTARIARALYPQASVLQSGFERVPLPSDQFDLAIGNPPFGKTSLYFPTSPELNGLTIHNQFFLGSMDAVRAGGLQIMVVSRYLLDAKDSETRRRLAEDAELVAAIRLPDSAFSENARTEVVTDVIVLRKLTEQERADRSAARKDQVYVEPDWIQSAPMPDPLGGDPMEINRYFHRNPSMVLGTLERSGSMRYGADVTVRPDPGVDLEAALTAIAGRLPAGVMTPSTMPVERSVKMFEAMRESLELVIGGHEEGNIFFNDDGKLTQVMLTEGPGDRDYLTRRTVDASSPWHSSLMMDADGAWFRLVQKLDENGQKVKNGRFNVYEREVFARPQDVPEELRLGEKALERLTELAKLRDRLRDQLVLETNDEPGAALEENRKLLREDYARFVKAFGFVGSAANQRLLDTMPDGPLVTALESDYDAGVTAARARTTGLAARKPSANPAPIMSKRVVVPFVAPERAESSRDAMTISLAETGRIDLERMAKLAGKTKQEIIDDLHTSVDEPLIFKDPETDTWEVRDAYLSGLVVRKLNAARDAGLEKNIVALESVQPPPIQASDIGVQLGATWVPPDVYAQFLEHLTKAPASVRFSRKLTTFDVRADSTTPEARMRWGTERAGAGDLVASMLNSRSIAVYNYYTDEHGNQRRELDREETELAVAKAEEIKNEFADWIMGDANRRRRLAEIYNEQFNNRVIRQYDGSNLVLPGKVPDAIVELRRHQKNAIWRGVSERFILIDHAVGAGKTYTAIARAMERRRMGMSKKPMIVVPNHMVEQFASDVYRLYPGARILALGQKDLEAKRRRRAFARIATGDWDIVIVPHSSFGFIGISQEREQDYLQQEIADVEEALREARAEAADEGGRFKPQSVKTAEALLKGLQQRMAKITDKKRDKLLTFEQMGIDDLTIDECFTWDTPILTDRGWLPIGKVVDEKISANVLSADLATGALEWRPIVRWIPIERHNKLVVVKHEHGHFTCTEDHKIWTQRGYVAAASLVPSDRLFVLRDDIHAARPKDDALRGVHDRNQILRTMRRNVQLPVGWESERREADFLQQSLRGNVAQLATWSSRGVQCADGWASRGDVARQGVAVIVGANEGAQPDAQLGDRGEGAARASGADVSGARREWLDDEAAADARGCARSAYGVRYRDGSSQGEVRESAALLQGGLGEPGTHAGDRSGREFAQAQEVEVLGCPENGGLECARVEGVEILERGSTDGSGSSGDDHSTVYDIEVAGNHNFFAAGVLVSNCHEFKNLMYHTRLQRVLGLGDQQGSKKAYDLYMKVRTLRDSPRGSVVFMTGTPISNSVVEMYTMMRYLAADALEDYGIDNFDAWHKQFAEAVTRFEQNEAGLLSEKTRLSRWANMPELMKLYYSFTDAVSLDDIKTWYKQDKGHDFPVPKVKGGKRRNVVVQPTPAQVEILDEVVSGFNGLEDIKDPRERGAERLRLMDRARKVALDARAAVRGLVSDERGGKLEVASDEIARIYHEWTPDKGAQLVFLDRSTKKSNGDQKVIDAYDKLRAEMDAATAAGDQDAIMEVAEKLEKYNAEEIAELREAQKGGWTAYDQIKRNLIERGIPENQIRFIQEANTDEQKQQLFDMVKSGEVRVLIGSTPKMGAGTNVQDRLVALHHIDVNWKPSDIEQREGRIIRQGNLLLKKYGDEFEVEIIAYATERTYDGKMWALNEAKGRFIHGLRAYSGEREVEIDDSESENMAEMAALASGNPLMLERVQLDAEVKKLEVQRRAHNRRQSAVDDALADARRVIETYPEMIERAKVDDRAVATAIEEAEQEMASRTVEIEGETFGGYIDAERAALAMIAEQRGDKVRGKFVIHVGDKPVTSLEGLQSALRDALGDAEPLPLKLEDGKTFKRINNAGVEITQIINAAAIDGENEVTIGLAKGIPLKAYIERGEGGELLATLFAQGDYVREAVEVKAGGDSEISSSAGKAFSPRAMIVAISRLLRDIGRGREAKRLQSALEMARGDLAELESQTGKPWPKADEYATKAARLKDVVSKLSGEAAENAPAATDIDEDADADPSVLRATPGAGMDLEPVSLEVAAGVVAGIRPTAEEVWKVELRLVPSFDALPQEAKDEIARDYGPDERPKGLLSGDVVYVIADQHDSASDVEATILHEIKGHVGVRRFYGADITRELNKLFLQIGGTRGLKQLADERNIDLGDYAAALATSKHSDDVRVRIMMEELLAHLAEAPRFMDRVKAIVGQFRAWLRKMGWVELPKMGQADLLWILKQADRKLGEPGPDGGPRGGKTPAVKRNGNNDPAEPSIVLRKGGNAMAGRARNKIADLFSGKSAKTFNWWQRTVGSQYGKARADADFGRVYEKAHDFIDDVSEFARSASDKAMGILPHMDTVGDVVKGLNARRAWSDAKDYQAISDAIFSGTLEDKVWNAGELRARFGLDDKQAALYKQFRDATDFSLETLASSEMARAARAEGMETADSRMSMAEAEAFYVGQVEPLVTAAREVIEGLRLKHRIELEDAAGQSEAKRDALIARQARERMAAEGALAKVAKLRDSFTEKAEQIRALQGKGYAPLMRFGQYTVDVVRLDEDGKPAKDDDGEIDRPFFGMFESEAEAREAEKIMRDEYPGYTVSRGVASTESSELYQGMSPEAAEMFARLLGVDVNDAFQTYLRQALNNRSAMKRLIKRKGMAGFANDIPRVLASFIASNARLASSNWHFGEMRKAAAAIPKHKGDVTDEAIKLMNYIQNPQEEAAAMRGFLFFNFLGGSLASAIVNTTQTFSTTLPYLNQFGAAKAAKAIGNAMVLGGKAMARGLDVVKGNDKDLHAALKRAAEDGIIDPQEIHLLMAEARGSGASNVLGTAAGLINESWRTPAARVGRAAMGAWGSFFSMAEKYNRHVAFIAAWDVAKDMTAADFKRIGVADRFEFARRAVIETQFDYTKASRPNWARGAIGATLFTFKTFIVNYMEFLSRLPSRERALALAVLFLMSGLSGAPGTDDLDDLIDTVGQKLGYNWNNESGRHAWLVDVLGKDGANFVEHGVSAFIPLDVSARLGMGNLIPGTGLLKDSTTTPSREIAEIFGPAGSVFMGAVDTFGNVGTGKDPLETLRPIMPKAINDFRQAYDIATSGEYRDYRGRKVVDADLGDAFIKAIGFHPNVVAEPKRVERMVQQSVALHRTRRAEINELWARGVVEKDAGKVERAREMLRDWNRKNPTAPIRMNPESVKARVRAMRSTSAERLVKASSKDMRGMVANEIAVKD